MPLKKQPLSLYDIAAKCTFQYIRDLHVRATAPRCDDERLVESNNNREIDASSSEGGTFLCAPKQGNMSSESDVLYEPIKLYPCQKSYQYRKCRICDNIQYCIQILNERGQFLDNKKFLQIYFSDFTDHDITPSMLRLFLTKNTETIKLSNAPFMINCVKEIQAKEVKLTHFEAHFKEGKCFEALMKKQIKLTHLSLRYATSTECEYILYLIGTHLPKLKYLSLFKNDRRTSNFTNAVLFLLPDSSNGRRGCVLLERFYSTFSIDKICLEHLIRELPKLAEISDSFRLYELLCKRPTLVSSAASLRAIDIQRIIENCDLPIMLALGQKIESVKLTCQVSKTAKIKSALKCFSKLRKLTLTRNDSLICCEDVQNVLRNCRSTLTHIHLSNLKHSDVLPIIVQNCHNISKLHLAGSRDSPFTTPSSRYGEAPDTVPYPLVELKDLHIEFLDQSCHAKWVKSLLGSSQLRKIYIFKCDLVTSHVLLSIIHAYCDTNHILCHLTYAYVGRCQFVNQSLYFKLLDADHIPLRELIVCDENISEKEKQELKDMATDRQLDMTLKLL